MDLMSECYKGVEEISLDEIREVLKVKGSKGDGFVRFESDKAEGLKTVLNIFEVLGEFKFSSFEDLVSKVLSLDFSFLKNDFFVSVKREGSHDFNSQDVRLELFRKLSEKYGKRAVFKGYKQCFYVLIKDSRCYVGKFVFEDLCKRGYKVRTSRESINACVANVLLRFSGYSLDGLVDYFCKDGVILIEAGGGYAFDYRECNVYSTKINAKLAKVKVNFSDFESVASAISVVPCPSKGLSEKKASRLVSEFFSNCLKKVKKDVCVMCRNEKFVLGLAKGFKLVKKGKILIGDSEYSLLLFKV